MKFFNKNSLTSVILLTTFSLFSQANLNFVVQPKIDADNVFFIGKFENLLGVKSHQGVGIIDFNLRTIIPFSKKRYEAHSTPDEKYIVFGIFNEEVFTPKGKKLSKRKVEKSINNNNKPHFKKKLKKLDNYLKKVYPNLNFKYKKEKLSLFWTNQLIASIKPYSVFSNLDFKVIDNKYIHISSNHSIYDRMEKRLSNNTLYFDLKNNIYLDTGILGRLKSYSNKFLLFNKKGKLNLYKHDLTPLNIENFEIINLYKNDKILAVENDKRVFFDLISMDYVIDTSTYEQVINLHDEIIFSKENHSIFYKILSSKSINKNFAIIKTAKQNFVVKQNDKWGLYDSEADSLIIPFRYETIHTNYQHGFIAKKNNEFDIFNIEGEFIFKIKSPLVSNLKKYIISYCDSIYTVWDYKGNLVAITPYQINGIKDGLIYQKINGEKVYCAYSGDKVLAIYEHYYERKINEQYLVVKNDYKYGLLNLDLSQKLPCIFDKIGVSNHAGNLLTVQKDQFWGVLKL